MVFQRQKCVENKKTNSGVVLKIIVKTKKKLVLKLREIMEKTITIAIVYI